MMRACRNAIILSYFGDKYGGTVAVAKNMGAALSKLGVEVSYWAVGDAEDRREAENIENTHIYDGGWPYSWFYSREMGEAFRMKAQSSFDIIRTYQMWSYNTWLAHETSKMYKIPYVIEAHGDLEPWRLRNTPFKRLKKYCYLNFIGRTLLRDCSCLQGCSEQELNGFKKIGYDGPVSIIPNGVDSDFYCPGDCEAVYRQWPDLQDKRIVLFMSRLSPEKGLDKLITAWNRLGDSIRRQNLVLVLAGPGDRGFEKQVEDYIAGSQYPGSIMMTGMVYGDLKVALYRASHTSILPTYNENFGIVVAEAMACGVPVITTTGTPWSALRDHQAGWWVDQTEDQLYRALCEALEISEAERRAMGERGRAYVRDRHSWDVIARQLVTLNECILSGKEIPLHPEPADI